ncbi:adenosylhomocysteinase [Motiliproteus sp. MSK22-1]|uniref:adenosylhomocysteinase n=1 Tax=Motiliproteus sp. MSK22-1 TaxID=1897630 RepID=UPI0009761072|nr:adenosylhomocysteinase [Motiliproteus sp. MSK22-1]OMH26614.1 hypothetical protein BGP75_23235 [Motiliproteus sp. MSK22-1]
MNPLFIKGNHFFEDIQPERSEEISFVVVTHLLDNPQIYLDCLRRIGDLAIVIPKPRSISRRTLEKVQGHMPVVIRTRSQLASLEVTAATINDYVDRPGLILIDVGGYFASTLTKLPKLLESNLQGVIEVTENGHQRYEAIDEPPVPIISIARSPLKGPEDYLTGQSLVYSAENLMRQCHYVMNGGNAVVFGYGKIGRSVAKSLHARNINVRVVDINPSRAIEARSRGFSLQEKEEALKTSDVIFCATGNRSLSNHDFSMVKNGAFIFSVTSSDDELELSRADENFEVVQVTEHISRYQRLGQFFYLANGGNAINFIHNAEVGPYIFLVQGEVILATELIVNKQLPAGLSELPEQQRTRLASCWLRHF